MLQKVFKSNPSLVILLVLLLIAMILSGCEKGQIGTEVNKEQISTEVNVLCTVPEARCQGFKEEFEAKYPITVNLLRMSSGEALARVQAEKTNPQFDIWWGGPIDSFIVAKKEGLLEAYDSPNYKNLLDQDKYKDKDNQWVGIYVASIGFATNKNWLATHPGTQPPKSWEDLLKPEFKGQIMIAHPSTSGTSYATIATILQLKGQEAGWAYLKRFASQVFQFTKSGAAPAKFVGLGEATVGILFSHEIVFEIEDNKLPLVLTFPEEGTGYDIGGMGILKGAKHLDAAKKWFDWALTPEMQGLEPKYGGYQAPTVKGVTVPHPELLQVKLVDYDFQWAAENRKAFVDKFTDEIAPAVNLK